MIFLYIFGGGMACIGTIAVVARQPGPAVLCAMFWLFMAGLILMTGVPA